MGNLISLVETFEPTINTLSSVFSMYSNYKRDKKVEAIENEIKIIKEVLCLNIYELSDSEYELIEYFLEVSIKNETNLNKTIYTKEIIEKVDLANININSLLLKLESEGFIYRDDGQDYKMNYSIFIESNFIKKLSSGTEYIEIMMNILNILIEISNNDETIYPEINVKEFCKKNSLNFFLINPVIEHLKNKEIIYYEDLMTNNGIYLAEIIYIKDKAKLLKLKNDYKLKL